MQKNIIVSAICVLILSLFIVFTILANNTKHTSKQKQNRDIVVEFLDSPLKLSSNNMDSKQHREIKGIDGNNERDICLEETKNENKIAETIEKTIEDNEKKDIERKNDKGEKNGKDGKDGIDGKDGRDGKDGKDGEDGKNGIDGKDGRDGKDGKNGLNGKDGKNPQKGIDYFTEDEKRGIVEDVVKEVYGLADNGEIVFSAENAYEVWLHSHEGTEEDFFDFLKGEKGDKGDKGEEGTVRIAQYTADYDETQNIVTFKCVTSTTETENIN